MATVIGFKHGYVEGIVHLPGAGQLEPHSHRRHELGDGKGPFIAWCKLVTSHMRPLDVVSGEPHLISYTELRWAPAAVSIPPLALLSLADVLLG